MSVVSLKSVKGSQLHFTTEGNVTSVVAEFRAGHFGKPLQMTTAKAKAYYLTLVKGCWAKV